MSKALDDTLDALESIEEVELKKLPLDILVNLIRVLIRYSTECNIKLKADTP